MKKGVDYGGRSYGAIHDWLRNTYGWPNRCENPECKLPSIRFEWSLVHGKGYDKVRGNFWQLCKLCHIRYDRQKPHSVSVETRDKIRTTLKNRFSKGLPESTKKKMTAAQKARRLKERSW